MKTCTKCGASKDLDSFCKKKSSKDGYNTRCKSCEKDIKAAQYSINKNDPAFKQKRHEYYLKNSDHIKQKTRINQENNPDKVKQWRKTFKTKHKNEISEYGKKRYQNKKEHIDALNKEWRNNNKERKLELDREYRANNKERLAIAAKKRLDGNPTAKLTVLLRGRLYKALKGKTKSASVLDLIGCDINDFKQHLESLFKPGMTWENYGKKGWEVDHIKPCASFDLTHPEQQRACFNYMNLRPLWGEENRKKHSKIMCNPCTFQWSSSKSWTNIPEGPMCNPTTYQGFK